MNILGIDAFKNCREANDGRVIERTFELTNSDQVNDNIQRK